VWAKIRDQGWEWERREDPTTAAWNSIQTTTGHRVEKTKTENPFSLYPRTMLAFVYLYKRAKRG
jgi:hypothetical protein